MLIDTHCHINLIVKEKFDTPLHENELSAVTRIIQSAQAKGVACFINIGSNIPESKNSVLLAQQFPEIFATVGIHPDDCTETWHADFKIIDSLIKNTQPGTIVAIGECGIDKHHQPFNLALQIDAFKAHIELALAANVPVVVHTRDAAEETLTCLSAYTQHKLKGVVHCFSEDLAYAQEIIKLGLHVGIGGAVTYPKNEKLRTVVANIPLSSILLETDAPWLPIQSMRGKKNEPQYIREIAEFIAQVRGESFATIARTTTTNAEKLFVLKKQV